MVKFWYGYLRHTVDSLIGLVEEGLLTKVVPGPMGESQSAIRLELLHTSLLNEVEKFSGVSVADDFVTSLHLLEVEPISDFGRIVRIDLVKQAQLLEEALISLSLLAGSFLDNIVEAGPVKSEAC